MSFVYHINHWPWGTTVSIVTSDGAGKVDLSFEKDNPGVCFLSGLSVIPEKRNQGIATRLLSDAIDSCRARWVFRIDLQAVKKDWLIEFYEKNGFSRCGERDDFIQMTKFLFSPG